MKKGKGEKVKRWLRLLTRYLVLLSTRLLVNVSSCLLVNSRTNKLKDSQHLA
ncbi:hypothetical protein HMPREF6745_1884 [Prevotella sp. oral taxon 472 str. F0295]|nr:hypothetical protein HMPREF6745_1884 [Prevotella sp. oral taxon 472 str. F0295]